MPTPAGAFPPESLHPQQLYGGWRRTAQRPAEDLKRKRVHNEMHHNGTVKQTWENVLFCLVCKTSYSTRPLKAKKKKKTYFM